MLDTVNELRINLSVNYYCGTIQILLGVNAVNELAQDLIMLLLLYEFKRLLSECSSVIRSDVELSKLMQDRDEWRKRIPLFVSENYN